MPASQNSPTTVTQEDESIETEESPKQETTPNALSRSTRKEFSAVAIVKIPLLFSEEKVKILIGSMEAQFEGTGIKVILVPEEVDIDILECSFIPTQTTKGPRKR